MFQKKTDLLEQQAQRMQQLQDMSASAVDVVESMLHDLQTVNESIELQKAEIDTYVSQLGNVKTGLADTYSKNEKVIRNIKKLLETEE